MKNRMKNSEPNSLIAEGSTNPVRINKEEIKSRFEVDKENIFNKIGRNENELLKFINTHVLKDDRKISDIWSVAYGDLFRHIYKSQNLLGIYVLHHIFYNHEIYSDHEKVLELKNDLDSNFWAKDETNLH